VWEGYACSGDEDDQQLARLIRVLREHCLADVHLMCGWGWIQLRAYDVAVVD
jgi:hypothetical protein